MKRHSSRWHGCVVLVQIDGVVSKCISLQEGFCGIAGAEKLPGFLFRPVSSLLGGAEPPPELQVVEQLLEVPACWSLGWCLCLSAFIRGKSFWAGLLCCLQSAPLSPCSEDALSALAATHPCLFPLPGLRARAER